MYEVVLYVEGTPRKSKQSPFPPHTILSFSSPGIGFGRGGRGEGWAWAGGGEEVTRRASMVVGRGKTREKRRRRRRRRSDPILLSPLLCHLSSFPFPPSPFFPFPELVSVALSPLALPPPPRPLAWLPCTLLLSTARKRKRRKRKRDETVFFFLLRLHSTTIPPPPPRFLLLPSSPYIHLSPHLLPATTYYDYHTTDPHFPLLPPPLPYPLLDTPPRRPNRRKKKSPSQNRPRSSSTEGGEPPFFPSPVAEKGGREESGRGS